MQPAPTSDDDLTLIRRVASRDRQAFEVLYHRYAQRVRRYLSTLIRGPEGLEEVLDDVMVVVWDSASRFRGASRLSTWILGIAHRTALKARARSARIAAARPNADAAVAEAPGPDDVAARREVARAVARMLDSLPPEQRATVELTCYEDRSYREVAEIMGCPVNTVKTRMFHARRRLAPVLADLGPSIASAPRKEVP